MTSETTQNITENKENTQVSPVAASIPSPEPAETLEQINWKKFRQAREEDRKRADAAEKEAAQRKAEAEALKAALEAVVNKPSSPSSASIPEEEEDAVRVRRLVAEAIQERERKSEEERKRKEQEELPSRLASTFTDFEKVCSAENLDYLEYHHPEVAKSLRLRNNDFEKWADVYKAVKRYIPNPQSKQEEAKIQKNTLKPQSMSVSGVTSTGDVPPRESNEKRREENWARMQRVMKGIK